MLNFLSNTNEVEKSQNFMPSLKKSNILQKINNLMSKKSNPIAEFLFDKKYFTMRHLILLTPVLGQAVAQCSRAALQQLAEGFHESVASGKLTLPVTGDLVYTENFKETSPGKGFLLSKPVKSSLHRHLLDTTTCATFTEIVAHENTPPYVIGAQVHYTGGKASKIEALVTGKDNGWLFDASATYNWASKESRPEIPEAKRDARKTIQAVADAYLDKFSNGSMPVPIATPCERLEGKMHVAPNCIAGMPTVGGGKSGGANVMTNRRYVIDEVVGTVDVFLNFGGMPDSHEYRVEEGKLKIVHTITVGSLGRMGKGTGKAPKRLM